MNDNRFVTTRATAVVAMATSLLAACGGSSDSAPVTDSVAPVDVESAPVDAAEPFPGAADDDTLTVLGRFAVDPGSDELIGDVPADQQAVWDRFSELIPASFRPEVQLFVPIDQEASDGTDGAMQTDPNDPSFYYIALDTTGSSAGAELDRTMIHEFGHLLSLGPAQITLNPDSIDECDVYAPDEGCPDRATTSTISRRSSGPGGSWTTNIPNPRTPSPSSCAERFGRVCNRRGGLPPAIS